MDEISQFSKNKLISTQFQCKTVENCSEIKSSSIKNLRQKKNSGLFNN